MGRKKRSGRNPDILDVEYSPAFMLKTGTESISAGNIDDLMEQMTGRKTRSDSENESPAPSEMHRQALPTTNEKVAAVAAMDRFSVHFATARALKRQIIAVVGPTNSGKSWTALNALAEAESGVALAPLRLLAHEFKEALADRGVMASLMTGEERICEPGSRHVAATVEMCPFRDPVDVAIIDEAQMLHDPDRGSAWTAAIMGVPARKVYVLGAPHCLPMVKRIADLCGDPVRVIRLERKSPISVSKTPKTLEDIRPGEAVVAFSRRAVYDIRATLLRQGKSVAVVYGGLSPDVRRAEAARFGSGEAQILVSTDAIGMGLNLPISGLYFSSLKKFDGSRDRDLTPQEIKQIGGRAGRYGIHERGLVGMIIGGGSCDQLARLFAAPDILPLDERPLVHPDLDIVKAVADEIGTKSLLRTLTRIQYSVLRGDDPNYRLADLTQQKLIAVHVDGLPLSLQDRWAYSLAPIDERDDGISRLAQWANKHALGRAVKPPEAGYLPPPIKATHDDLYKAEQVHKRLVTWRWLAQRYPEFYVDADTADAESSRLDLWIEKVLSGRPSTGRGGKSDGTARQKDRHRSPASVIR
jgi:ATP-dependent RNA helicase SUPV3L1/SUV3